MTSLRRRLPSAHALFVFEAAARRGNFTAAATELYVTQPAVSRMIARLEDHMGVALFQRGTSGLTLTESGEILYRKTSEGFRAIEWAIEEINARKSTKDTVSLSVSTAFTNHWLMPRMHEIHAAMPRLDLRFQLISGSIGGPVENVDLGMRFVAGEDSEHSAELIMPELLIPVCSPAYKQQMATDRRGARASTKADTLIVLSASDTDWFSYFPELHETALSPSNQLVFSDYAVVIQAALLGQGIAVGWLNVVSHWLDNGALVPALDQCVASGRLCHFVRSRKQSERAPVAQVRDWIIDRAQREALAIDRRYPQLGIADRVARSVRADAS